MIITAFGHTEEEALPPPQCRGLGNAKRRTVDNGGELISLPVSGNIQPTFSFATEYQMKEPGSLSWHFHPEE